MESPRKRKADSVLESPTPKRPRTLLDSFRAVKPREGAVEPFVSEKPKCARVLDFSDAATDAVTLKCPPDDVFRYAIDALHLSSVPDVLTGRESEQQLIAAFWQGCLRDRKGGSLYVSGKPGTGKTAVLSRIVSDVARFTEAEMLAPAVAIITNCMQLRSPRDVFRRLLALLAETGVVDRSRRGRVNEMQQFELAVLRQPGDGTSPMLVVVVDELDQLTSEVQDVLYTLFDLAARPTSRLVLVGIANTLDLTDRVLPRLEKKGLAPTKVDFLPYSAPQIEAIVKQRLARVSSEVFDPRAIAFCAKKAESTGDARRALDMCRAALEKLEAARTTGGAVRTVSVGDLSETTRLSATATSMQRLTTHQKVALCAAASLVRARKAMAVKKADVPTSLMYEAYKLACAETMPSAVGQGEFCFLCVDLMESSLIRCSTSKPRKGSRSPGLAGPQIADRTALLVEEATVRTALAEDICQRVLAMDFKGIAARTL